jgi:PIN domain-containing protein
VANFSDGFLPYLPPDEARTRRVLRDGIVVVDTNVLLDAYRYTDTAREELFAALRALGERLWVPHQVALEFHRNRSKVIASHGDAYSEVATAITDVKKQHDEDLNRRIREFANRVALDEPTLNDLLNLVEWNSAALVERINGMRAAHGVSDSFLREDPVLKKLQGLLEGRVGDPLSKDDENAARQEAQRRIDEGRAPGFKDATKADPCGDYLLWHQSLLEAKRRSLPLMLVTRDGKADWFLKMKGKSLGALPELVAEALEVAGVDFVAIPTKSFLLHANIEFGANISQATLAQTDAIQRRGRERATLFSETYGLNKEAADTLSADLESELERAIATLDMLRQELDSQAPLAANEIDSLMLRISAVESEMVAMHRLKEELNSVPFVDDAPPVKLNFSSDVRELIDRVARRTGRRGYFTRIPQPVSLRKKRDLRSLMADFAAGQSAALDQMTRPELLELAGVFWPDDQAVSRFTKAQLISRLSVHQMDAPRLNTHAALPRDKNPVPLSDDAPADQDAPG